MAGVFDGALGTARERRRSTVSVCAGTFTPGRRQRALRLLEKACGPDHPDLLPVLMNYAELLRKQERYEEARKLEDRARGLQQKHFKEQPPEPFRQKFLT